MAHEILSVKLCQLDDRVGRLHSRIHMSETARHSQLRQEIDALEQECAAAELALRQELQMSKSTYVAALAKSYEEMEQVVKNTRSRLRTMTGCCEDPEACAEAKVLLAEYALDFAHQAADRALLLAMEAIDAQRTGQEGDRSSL